MLDMNEMTVGLRYANPTYVTGQELPPDGENFRGGYRAKRCGVLTGLLAGLSVLAPSVWAIDATDAPVSIAVELETLVTSIFRYCSGVRR
jgi:hypothetical protein